MLACALALEFYTCKLQMGSGSRGWLAMGTCRRHVHRLMGTQIVNGYSDCKFYQMQECQPNVTGSTDA